MVGSAPLNFLTMTQNKDTSRTIRIVALTFILTVAATLLVLNFTSGERKIEERVERQYALRDDQFQRALGVLLGPPITTGNEPHSSRATDLAFQPLSLIHI